MVDVQTQGSIKNKNRADDRIFVLKPIEGKFSISASGNTDTSLFKGDNNLHARMNEYSNWYLAYDKGAVPPMLKQQWTSFTKLERFVKEYYLKRNVEVVKIID